MTASRLRRTLLAAAVLATAVAGVAVLRETDDYSITAALPSGHPKLSPGTPVYVDGFPVGEVVDISPEDNQAIFEIRVSDDAAPLHDGATLRVEWKSLVGERILVLDDGPDDASEIPDGGVIKGDNPAAVEIGDVLAALDAPTRRHLRSFIGQFQQTLGGHEEDLRRSLETLGPALAALGEVTRSIGSDGPAIRSMVTNLNRLMARIDDRSGDLQQTIVELSRLSGTVAGKRNQLRQVLSQLPETLRTAQNVLGDVPATTDAATPLLRELGSATEGLPSTSTQLARFLGDLRPLVADLRPTLRSASLLLDQSPALLGSMHATLPDITDATEGYLPGLEFLRPYTPEAVGFLTTWGLSGQNYDSNGRYMRIHGQAGPTSFNANPGVGLPGFSQDLTPDAGAPGGVPQDAEGEEMN